MVDRIATYAQSTKISGDLMRLQSSYAKGVAQESSGLKAENYQGIASSAQRLLNLEAEYSSLSTQSETTQIALDQVNVMYSSVQSMSDLVTSFKSTLSAAMSGSDADTATLSAQASDSWAEFVSLLNTQFAGSYVFGGGVTDVAPVDSNYAAATVPSTADTSYYQGDDYTKAYGVNADNAAFEKVMRAFNLVVNNPSDSAALSEAFTLLGDAGDALGVIQTKLSNQANTFDNQINQNATDLNTLDSVMSDIKNVDISAVLLKLTSLQTQIETSYSISTDILKMSLADYL